MLEVRGRRRSILAHVVRLRRFANDLLGSDIDMLRLQQEAEADYPNNVVKRLVEHRMGTKGGMEVRVRWLGFPPEMDTWEPVVNLAEDVADLVEEYLHANAHDNVCKRMLVRYFGDS